MQSANLSMSLLDMTRHRQFNTLKPKTESKYESMLALERVAGGEMAVCGGDSEWTPEGDRKGRCLSMGDGEYTSLTKYAYVGTQ